MKKIIIALVCGLGLTIGYGIQSAPANTEDFMGFIGCVNGSLLIKNIRFENISVHKVIKINYQCD